MSNLIEVIHLLEDRLKNVLTNYEFLKEENKVLLQNATKLRYQLQEKEQQLEKQQKQYDLLKVVKTIEGSNENKRDTKLKINALIREIDKCIVQLNQ